MDAKFLITLFFLLILIMIISVTSGARLQQTWTNENNDTVFNNPDKPTKVTFTTCTKILSITTNHWNYGEGDIPGKISLVHEDGTVYGPWRAYGINGSNTELNVYWSYSPKEVIKAGTYLVGDTGQMTWAENDASDNRGIVTIISEPSSCLNETGDISENSSFSVLPTPTIPAGMEDGIPLTPGEIDPSIISGGAIETETVPVIEQVVFRLLNGPIHGGDPVYALLRVKNTGYRALEEGYISIRLVSPTDITSYRSGMAKLPTITAGEERDIPLIIPTSRPGENETASSENTLLCTNYILEGTIYEHMQGIGFVRRGDFLLPREKMLSVTGCCREPHSEYIIRECR